MHQEHEYALLGGMNRSKVAAWAVPVPPLVGVHASDMVLVAKKTKTQHKAANGKRTPRGDGQRLDRVTDIDRRERRTSTRHTRSGKPTGCVPARNRTGDSEAFNAFMLGTRRNPGALVAAADAASTFRGRTQGDAGRGGRQRWQQRLAPALSVLGQRAHRHHQ